MFSGHSKSPEDPHIPVMKMVKEDHCSARCFIFDVYLHERCTGMWGCQQAFRLQSVRGRRRTPVFRWACRPSESMDKPSLPPTWTPTKERPRRARCRSTSDRSGRTLLIDNTQWETRWNQLTLLEIRSKKTKKKKKKNSPERSHESVIQMKSKYADLFDFFLDD